MRDTTPTAEGPTAEGPDALLEYLRQRSWNPLARLPERAWADSQRMIRAAARRYAGAGGAAGDLDDLAQEGTYALIRAADRFDPARGVPWAAYARAAVRHALADAARAADPLTRDDRAVLRAMHPCPEHAGLEHAGLEHAGLGPGAGGPPSPAQRRARAALAAARRARARGPEPGEDAHDRCAPGPEEAALDALELDALRAALVRLPARDREIVWMRVAEGAPVRQVAARHRVSGPRVSQIAARATGALRDALG